MIAATIHGGPWAQASVGHGWQGEDGSEIGARSVLKDVTQAGVAISICNKWRVIGRCNHATFCCRGRQPKGHAID